MREPAAPDATGLHESGGRVPLSRLVQLALLVSAVGGGWVATAIALLPGLLNSDLILALGFLLVPFVEEALKPLGLYFAFLRWPRASFDRLQVALLAAAAGLTFGLVESWVFVEGHPEEGSDYVLFRFTAPVAMHTLASFMFGLGLAPTIIDWLRRRSSLPADTRQAYLLAVGVHYAYNIAVVLLAVMGVRDYVGESQ